MKFLYLIIAIAIGALIGGPAYIAVSGYDALSISFWTTSLSVLFTEPGTIANAAFGGGENAELFQGIAMVGVGVVLLVIAFGLALIGPALKRKAKVKSTRINPSEFEATLAQDEEGSQSQKKSTLSAVKEKLAAKTEKTASAKEGKTSVAVGLDEFHDEVLEEEKKSGGFMAGLKGRIKDIKKKPEQDDMESDAWKRAMDEAGGMSEQPSKVAMPAQEPAVKSSDEKLVVESAPSKNPKKSSARINKKTASVRIGKDSLIDKVRDGLSGFLSSISRNNKAGTTRDEDVNGNGQETQSGDQGKVARVFDWYKKVQEGSTSKLDLVSEAKVLISELSEDDREAVVDRNSMDGAFILRLLESWASRNDFDDEEGADDAKAAMREAIRAVKKGKVEGLEIDESKVPQDFQQMLEEEEDVSQNPIEEIEDDVGSQPTVQWKMDGLANPVEDEREDEDGDQSSVQDEPEDDENPDDKMVEKIGRLAKEMKWLVSQSRLVADGEDEWPEHLASEDFRMEEASRLEEEMGRIMFLFDDDEMRQLLEEQDDEDYAWLLENFEIVTGGFEAFAKDFIVDDVDESDASDDEDEGDEPSESVSSDEPKNDDDEEQEDVSSDEEVSSVNDDEEVDVDEEDASALEEALANIANERDASSEAEEETSHQEDDATEDDGSSVDEAESVDIEEETVSVDTSQEEEADEGEPDVEDSPELPVVDDTPREPRDLSKLDMEEMSLASKSVMAWGVISKKAGAGAGTMMRFLFERGTEEILPVGSIHLVAMWKEQDKRMNVLLRYLEEGEWVYDRENPGSFVRSDDDFVNVAKGVFDHQEIKQSVVVIHAHGPGAESLGVDAPVKWADNVWLVTRVMDEAEIAKAMGI